MKRNNKNIILAFKKKVVFIERNGCLRLLFLSLLYTYYYYIIFIRHVDCGDTKDPRTIFFLLNPLSAAPIGERASFFFYRRRNVITIINRIHLTITHYYY